MNFIRKKEIYRWEMMKKAFLPINSPYSLHSCHRGITCCVSSGNGWQECCHLRVSPVTPKNREGEKINREGDFLKRESEKFFCHHEWEGQIVSGRNSWRRIWNSWWRVGRINYLFGGRNGRAVAGLLPPVNCCYTINYHPGGRSVWGIIKFYETRVPKLIAEAL